MQIKEKILEIGKQLPRGSYKDIATKTGLRPNTVIDIFKGRTSPNLETLRLIMPIAKKILEETKEMLALLNIGDEIKD